MDCLLLVRKIKELRYKFLSQFFYKLFFKEFGKGSRIINPLKIRNSKFILLGKNVSINDYVFLMALPTSNNDSPYLSIGDNVNIGHFNHIICNHKIIIENDVLTADHVYISDNNHNYSDVNIPISKQGIVSKAETYIGEGSWIGENVCIISAHVGKHCVIGANSVVINNIPDYSVAVGNPARVIKQYDFQLNKWVRR